MHLFLNTTCVFFFFCFFLAEFYRRKPSVSDVQMHLVTNDKKRKPLAHIFYHVSHWICGKFYFKHIHFYAHCGAKAQFLWPIFFFARSSLALDTKPQQIKIALLSVSMIECALKTNENKRERQVYIVTKFYSQTEDKKKQYRIIYQSSL